MTLLYVALGGAIGATARYLVMAATGHLSTLPIGTFIVNVTGSLLMGLLIGYLVKTLPHSMELRAFLAVGVLGGYTTFSTYALDIITLIEKDQWLIAATYTIGSVVASIIALGAGLYLMRAWG